MNGCGKTNEEAVVAPGSNDRPGPGDGRGRVRLETTGVDLGSRCTCVISLNPGSTRKTVPWDGALMRPRLEEGKKPTQASTAGSVVELRLGAGWRKPQLPCRTAVYEEGEEA